MTTIKTATRDDLQMLYYDKALTFLCIEDKEKDYTDLENYLFNELWLTRPENFIIYKSDWALINDKFCLEWAYKLPDDFNVVLLPLCNFKDNEIEKLEIVRTKIWARWFNDMMNSVSKVVL